MDPTFDQPVAEKPGTQIGPYELLQQIREGGMGVVYMAMCGMSKMSKQSRGRRKWSQGVFTPFAV